MRVLVNIRGCNGAGKSTIPMSMLDDLQLRVEPARKKNGKAVPPFVTVFPSYEWVALGTYYNKTGGMDTFGNKEMGTNDMTAMALEYAWMRYPDYDILMEGVIASTVKSTYANLFHEYEQRIDEEGITPRKIIIMSFLPPVNTCIERVYARNGGKPVKEEQIKGKWETVNRNVDYFKNEGFLSLRIDNSRCKKEKMLVNFLKTVEKYR